MFVRIFSGFIFSKEKRKEWRRKYLINQPASSAPPLLNNVLDNKILIVEPDGSSSSVSEIQGLKVNFKGKHARLVVHYGTCFTNSSVTLGDNALVEIGEEASIRNLHISQVNSAQVKIGHRFKCIGCTIECHDESGLDVFIGNDCLFSYQIIIRTSDGHTIYDTETGNPVNIPKRGVKIGNNVWIGMRAVVLKESVIPNNSVVAACALVSGEFEEQNTILAGVPAKVIKRNINWDVRNTQNFVKQNNLSGV